MKILYIEHEEEPVEELKLLHNCYSEADIDVVKPSDMDSEDLDGIYDVALSRLYLGDRTTAADVLTQAQADHKAIYTAWDGDKSRDNTSITEAMDRYDIIWKTDSLDLQDEVRESLEA